MRATDTFILAADAADDAGYSLSHTPSDGILVALGFLMILTFMALIMTNRMTPMVALILVPTVFGLIAGAGLGLGDMVIDAVKDMAPTAALLMFAIMFFGIMIDVGLFDPLIRWITRLLGNDPAKIVLGTAVLAGAVSLDGDGSTTYIITTSAMLPLYPATRHESSGTHLCRRPHQRHDEHRAVGRPDRPRRRCAERRPLRGLRPDDPLPHRRRSRLPRLRMGDGSGRA
jgi:hypothetical protein